MHGRLADSWGICLRAHLLCKRRSTAHKQNTYIHPRTHHPRCSKQTGHGCANSSSSAVTPSLPPLQHRRHHHPSDAPPSQRWHTNCSSFSHCSRCTVFQSFFWHLLLQWVRCMQPLHFFVVPADLAADVALDLILSLTRRFRGGGVSRCRRIRMPFPLRPASSSHRCSWLRY